MRLRFGLMTLAWVVTAFTFGPEWRVLALAVTGTAGAFALRSSWRDDVPSLLRWRDWLLGIAVGVGMALLTGPAYRLSVTIVPALQPEVARLYGLMGLSGRPLMLFPFLVVVVVEELLWRGAAFRLGVVRSPWTVALVATTLYALAQVGLLSPVVVLVALACGLAWSALRVLTGGLAAGLASHVVWDLAVFVLFPLE